MRNGNDALQVNWLELIITHEKPAKPYTKTALLPITNTNVVQIAEIERTRWKIESENNNTLKTKGYHLKHNFGHGQQDLANVLATLNMLAFLIHPIQEITALPTNACDMPWVHEKLSLTICEH